jgi:hypothetical protein
VDYIDTPVLRFYDGNCDGDCKPTTDPSDTICSRLPEKLSIAGEGELLVVLPHRWHPN